MKTLLTVLIMLPAAAGAALHNTVPSQPLQAIYVLHTGESDKPIWPFVLALAPPPPEDVARILQAPFWRHADLFIVSTQTLAGMARIMQDRLPAMGASESAPQAFGSFRVSLVTVQDEHHFVMTPEQSKQMFQDILGQIDPSQTDLRFHFANLLQRLGVTTRGDQ